MNSFSLLRTGRSLAILMTIVFTSTSSAFAAFDDTDWGARPAGMAGAFTAIADDSNAPLYNPAGIVQVQWNEISAMYAALFSGLTLYSGQDQIHLDQSYLAYASKPISHFGSWALSWASLNATHLYREDTVVLTYARNVGDFIPALNNDLSLGVNLKYLHRGVSLDASTTNDPVFSGGDSASAGTGDVGLLYKPEDGFLSGWRFGATGQNLTDPNVGFQTTDRVPLEWRLGVAFQSRLHPWIVPALDLTRRDGVNDAHAGVESWLFNDSLGLRAGVDRDEGAMGISYYQTLNKHVGFRLDYGIEIPFYVSGTDGDQRLSLTVYF